MRERHRALVADARRAGRGSTGGSATQSLRRLLRARGATGWPRPASEMSERFLRGGRLLAFGRGPYATDAQHVSVEFVHPVIVGKRALPALDLSLAVRALARRWCAPTTW